MSLVTDPHQWGTSFLYSEQTVFILWASGAERKIIFEASSSVKRALHIGAKQAINHNKWK